MLKNHIDAVEEHLLSISKIPANAGHTLHKGTPREAFIKEFLEKHLNKNVTVGTGEIIDHNSGAKQSRNQYDLVIYKNDYPKLDFGGGIYAFLAESVIATIEVKSKLTQKDIKQAVLAAKYAKSLERSVVTSFTAGHIPPAILNYVVAYDGPAKLETVANWIENTHNNLEITLPELGENLDERVNIPSPSIDGVFILGKGLIQFDNSPIGFCTDEAREKVPEAQWVLANCERGSLLFLFTMLLQATNNVQGVWLNPLPYLKTFSIDDIILVTEKSCPTPRGVS